MKAVKGKQLGISKLWGRGYTTVPVTVRRVLGVSDGDTLEWVLLNDGTIAVRKLEVDVDE